MDTSQRDKCKPKASSDLRPQGRVRAAGFRDSTTARLASWDAKRFELEELLGSVQIA